MDFIYVDYKIVQNGRELVCDSSIKLMKYENRVSRLVFEIDRETFPDAKFYVAFLNPLTKAYHYEPLIDDKLIIGTSVTYYVGKHKMILVGVTPSFELDDNITFDQIDAIYVSKEFNKIVVLDNFLNDDAQSISLPNFDKAIENIVSLHDNVVALSEQTADDATNCKETLNECNVTLDSCKEILGECKSILDQVQNIQINVSQLQSNLSSAYNTYTNQLTSLYEEYIESMREEANRIVSG